MSREIIWAVSLLDTSIETIENTKRFFSQMYGEGDYQLIPVYIRENHLVDSSGHFPRPEKYLGPDLNIIENSGYTTLSYAEKFLEFVSGRDVETVLVNTPGKSLAERFFMGSFCEHLVQNSEVPITVIGPSCNRVEQINHILFPTDISKVSETVFKKCVDTFANRGLRISLVTELMQSETMMASAMGSAWVNIEPFPVEDVKRTKQQLTPLVLYAEKNGFQVDTTIESQLSSTAAAVNSLAEVKKVSMIVMATESGAVSRSLFGSVGREIVQNSVLPVMIYPLSAGES